MTYYSVCKIEALRSSSHPSSKYVFLSGKASPVGDKPGVTRAVLTSIRVSNNPLVYLVDTPGIMVPNISDMHVGLKLALCCKHNSCYFRREVG